MEPRKEKGYFMPRKMQRKLRASKSKGIKHMMKHKMMDKKMGMPKGKGTMMVKGY